MSAADRMVVRTSAGVRSLPRREALALISTRRAKIIPPPSPRSGAVRVVTAESPALKTGEIELPGGPEDRRTLADLGLTQADLLPEFQAERGKITFAPDVSVPADDVTALPIVAPAVEQPKGNAGREAWAEYAGVHGVPVSEDMGRNDIRDTVLAKLESDRMSRPAFEGGRPATPEDEPVTESAVTHADPGERTA